MSYAYNNDLPPSVRSDIPEYARDHDREGFKRADTEHAGGENGGGITPNCRGSGKEALRETGRALGCKAVRR